ncbi:MAG: DUF5678 domain-containing protein [Methanosarcinales archaeon]
MKIWSGNKNMECYHRMEDELLEKHHGKIAVFYDGNLVAIGNDIEDAVTKARKVSKGKEFFVKEIFTPEEQAEAIL